MKRLQEIINKSGVALLKVDGIFGQLSLSALQKYLDVELKKRKFVVPTNGLVWIRTDQILSNTFDDFVAVYKSGIVVYAAPASTTAGDYYIYNPITYGGITGTAVALEQQVLKSHTFVTGANWTNLWLKAPYFQQSLPIDIFRDGNKDRKLDKIIIKKGMFGINFHRGGIGNVNGNWSAGCCIVPDNHWFEIVKRFNINDKIDFTLIEVV